MCVSSWIVPLVYQFLGWSTCLFSGSVSVCQFFGRSTTRLYPWTALGQSLQLSFIPGAAVRPSFLGVFIYWSNGRESVLVRPTFRPKVASLSILLTGLMLVAPPPASLRHYIRYQLGPIGLAVSLVRDLLAIYDSTHQCHRPYPARALPTH